MPTLPTQLLPLQPNELQYLRETVTALFLDVAWRDGEHADECDRINDLLSGAGDDEEALRLALTDAQELLSTLAQEWGTHRPLAVALYERIDEALGTA